MSSDGLAEEAFINRSLKEVAQAFLDGPGREHSVAMQISFLESQFLAADRPSRVLDRSTFVECEERTTVSLGGALVTKVTDVLECEAAQATLVAIRKSNGEKDEELDRPPRNAELGALIHGLREDSSFAEGSDSTWATAFMSPSPSIHSAQFRLTRHGMLAAVMEKGFLDARFTAETIAKAKRQMPVLQGFSKLVTPPLSEEISQSIFHSYTGQAPSSFKPSPATYAAKILLDQVMSMWKGSAALLACTALLRDADNFFDLGVARSMAADAMEAHFTLSTHALGEAMAELRVQQVATLTGITDLSVINTLRSSMSIFQRQSWDQGCMFGCDAKVFEEKISQLPVDIQTHEQKVRAKKLETETKTLMPRPLNPLPTSSFSFFRGGRGQGLSGAYGRGRGQSFRANYQNQRGQSRGSNRGGFSYGRPRRGSSAGETNNTNNTNNTNQSNNNSNRGSRSQNQE